MSPGATRYATGRGTAVCGPGVIGLVEAAAGAVDTSLQQVVDAVIAGENVSTVVDRLASVGVRELPDFALAFTEGDRVRLLLRGDVHVATEDEHGEANLVDATDYRTWREVVLTNIATIRLSLPPVDGTPANETAATPFALVAGSAPADALAHVFAERVTGATSAVAPITTDGPTDEPIHEGPTDDPSATDGPTEEAAPGSRPAPGDATEAGTEGDATEGGAPTGPNPPVAPLAAIAPNPSVAPVAPVAPAPSADDDFDFGHLLGDTRYGSVESGAVRPHEPNAPAVGDEHDGDEPGDDAPAPAAAVATPDAPAPAPTDSLARHTQTFESMVRSRLDLDPEPAAADADAPPAVAAPPQPGLISSVPGMPTPTTDPIAPRPQAGATAMPADARPVAPPAMASPTAPPPVAPTPPAPVAPARPVDLGALPPPNPADRRAIPPPAALYPPPGPAGHPPAPQARPARPPVPAPPTPTPPVPPHASPTAAPAPPSAGQEPDGPTIGIAALRALRAGSTPSSPVTQAVHCADGHPNPPYAEGCRRCAAPITDRSVTMVPRPCLGQLRFADGMVVRLDQPVLLGRRPPGDAVVNGEPARSVAVHDPARALSRLHVEVRLVDWQVLVVDRDSMNHTYVEVPGHTPIQLRPAEPFPIPLGSTVSLGDAVRATYEIEPA